MTDKKELTKVLLEKMHPDDQFSLDYAMNTWWQDIREKSGWRLSAHGFAAFKDLGIARYEFDVPPSTPLLPNVLLTLNKKLTCPYYIQLGKAPKIVFFGSKEATMYSLYGDVNKFIESISKY